MNPLKQFVDYLSGTTVVDNHGAERQAAAEELHKVRRAIASNETSVIPEREKYLSSQSSGVKAFGKAMGKYRVTEAELKSYGPRFLGEAVDSKKFMNEPWLQDRYMTQKIAHYKNLGYTNEQIADIHNKGIKNAGDPGTKTYQSPKYVENFIKAYGT